MTLYTPSQNPLFPPSVAAGHGRRCTLVLKPKSCLYSIRTGGRVHQLSQGFDIPKARKHHRTTIGLTSAKQFRLHVKACVHCQGIGNSLSTNGRKLSCQIKVGFTAI